MRVEEALAGYALPLDEWSWQKLQAFHELLLEKNQVMDLTKVPEEEMPVRHYLDSLQPLGTNLFPQGARLMDVGSGAGFPGLPIAIARPDLQVTLLESMQKRCAFLQEAVDALKLENVRVIRGRAEDLAHQPSHRERYSLVSARAVAGLPVLAEYLLPFVKPGGMALCWKGPAVLDERKEGARAARMLGGTLGELMDLHIPGRSHYLQVLHKTGTTPAKYPRKAGVPAKSPLGTG